jgi:AcrR family transcriptional regulator
MATVERPLAADAARDRRPLRADAARNRQRLLNAADAVFAERGLDATMDEVARRAEVGVGTAYRRFRNRDDLIAALFEERLEELMALLDDALADPDPWRGMTGFFERWLELQVEDRGFRELLLQSADGRERVRRFRERLRPLMAELLGRARAAGALRPDIEERDTPLIILMVNAVHDFAHEVEPELWRRALGLVLDGLRAERPTPTPLPVAALEPEQADRAMATWRPARPGR